MTNVVTASVAEHVNIQHTGACLAMQEGSALCKIADAVDMGGLIQGIGHRHAPGLVHLHGVTAERLHECMSAGCADIYLR